MNEMKGLNGACEFERTFLKSLRFVFFFGEMQRNNSNSKIAG